MFIKPRKASTVAVLRDDNSRMKVLLMRRHLNDRFLPDHIVFPGGALDDQDYDFKFTGNRSKTELKDFDGISSDYYGYILCGIRETFEESGILFAEESSGKYPMINTGDSIEKFTQYRKLVFEQRISFMDMLIKENLSPAVEKFVYMSRWVTPPLFPIRYDTRFFAAISPECQETSHDNNELVDFQWMTPGEALHNYKNNKIKMVMPTIKTLEFLSEFKRPEEVIKHFHR